MNNYKYKKYFSVIIVLGFILILTGVSYSFFNYTKTGSYNNFSVGRINFISRQTETFNLTNMFPIDPEEPGIMDDEDKVGTMVLEIEGDTDYVNGLEYLVSVVDANIYTSNGKLVPVSIDITVDDLGNSNDNYFTARESKNASIYKKLVGDTLVGDQMLLVGYIKPNTTQGTIEGIDGSITIKAYFDENKIGISDTYDMDESNNPSSINEWAEGKTIFTTSEWSNLNVSFKIRVEANEGIWVNGSLEEVMKKTAVMDNINSTYVNNSTPGIDFSESSSDTNGKGLYINAGTENNDNPIIYYRGDVENNNVYFANFCWKAVRTTEKGGVKLIYNGEKRLAKDYENHETITDNDITYTNDATYPYTYDSNTKKWTSGNSGVNNTSSGSEITFSVKEAGNYTINYEVSSFYRNTVEIYKDGLMIAIDSEEKSNTVNLGDITPQNVIKIGYYKYSSTVEGNDNAIFEIIKNYGDFESYETCNNMDGNSVIRDTSDNTLITVFSYDYDSPAYNSYMQGEVYTQYYTYPTSGAYFGNTVTYSNGEYSLVTSKVGYDGTHHYTCNLTNSTGTCNVVRFYIYDDVYIELSNGETIDVALDKMLSNKSDSNLKTIIDTWYSNNLTSYTSKIEDEFWCVDRSIYSLGSWDPNVNNSDSNLYFGSYNRLFNSRQPSFSCSNKKDRLTVNDTAGSPVLTYPISLLTADEIDFAGVLNSEDENFKNYLLNNKEYWLLSPYRYRINSSYASIVYYTVHGYNWVDNTSTTRPSIVIKKGQLITKGDGSYTNPYVIE